MFLKKNGYNVDNELLLEYIHLENPIVQENLPPILKLFKKTYDSKIELIKLHYKYYPDGYGYNEAKNDFIDLLKS